MGYYVKSDYSNYYEGSKLDVSDISVTQRPHEVCEYDGAAWTYPIASAQDYQKRRVSRAMKMDLDSILSMFYLGYYDMMMIGFGMIESTAFEDDTGRAAASVSFLNGYKTQGGSATLQIAADEIQADWTDSMNYLGKAFAQRRSLMESIQAETVGLTCLSYEWVPL